MSRVYQEIAAEVRRQHAKFGDQSDKHPQTWSAVLQEEKGEVAKAVLEGDLGALILELRQTAAVCVNWLQVLEATTDPQAIAEVARAIRWGMR
jgi:NTP pyrophosphatase (non-canonical NTP hydrolase)